MINDIKLLDTPEPFAKVSVKLNCIFVKNLVIGFMISFSVLTIYHVMVKSVSEHGCRAPRAFIC